MKLKNLIPLRITKGVASFTTSRRVDLLYSLMQRSYRFGKCAIISHLWLPFRPETNGYPRSNVFQLRWSQFVNRPLELEPEKTTIVLFPGQGAQFVGMGKHLLNTPKVRQMFQLANETLRTNLLDICLNGPQAKLNQTVHCQPATYVVSLSAMLKLQEEHDEDIKNCVAVAGFSLGEITALVFAGSLTFEQGLHLIRVRAEAMQKACDQCQGAMLSVFVTHESQLNLAISAAVDYCKTELRIAEPVCRVANYLYSDCKVVAGHKEAIEFIEQHISQFSIRKCKRLPVSGAFHTSLMRPALRPMLNAVSRLGELKSPAIPVISAVDVLPYANPHSIGRKISFQIIRPVRWEQVLHALYTRPPDASFPRTIEPGPGRQLGAMLSMVNRKAFSHYRSIEV